MANKEKKLFSTNKERDFPSDIPIEQVFPMLKKKYFLRPIRRKRKGMANPIQGKRKMSHAKLRYKIYAY